MKLNVYRHCMKNTITFVPICEMNIPEPYPTKFPPCTHYYTFVYYVSGWNGTNVFGLIPTMVVVRCARIESDYVNVFEILKLMPHLHLRYLKQYITLPSEEKTRVENILHDALHYVGA